MGSVKYFDLVNYGLIESDFLLIIRSLTLLRDRELDYHSTLTNDHEYEENHLRHISQIERLMDNLVNQKTNQESRMETS